MTNLRASPSDAPGLTPRRATIHLVAIVGLLFCARLLFDFASASAYVYPEADFGQSGLLLLILGLMLLFVLILACIRVLQKRFVEGLVLFMALCIPFLFSDLIDRRYWKFQINKPMYQSAVVADQSSTPKYKVFNWGNRNTSLGGGYLVEGIVYDESDEIARAPDSRSAAWKERHSNPSPDDRWVTASRSSYPICKMIVRSLGDHFFYVSEEC